MTSGSASAGAAGGDAAAAAAGEDRLCLSTVDLPFDSAAVGIAVGEEDILAYLRELLYRPTVWLYYERIILFLMREAAYLLYFGLL